MNVPESIQLIAAVIALAALLYTAYSVSMNRRVTRAQFWLTLRDHFAAHDQIHRRLRPGGEWASSSGPSSAEEWAAVEAYMGLLEHCEVMLRESLIDRRTFGLIYGYRVSNIVACETIVREKLTLRKEGWPTFVSLCERLKIAIPELGTSSTSQ